MVITYFWSRSIFPQFKAGKLRMMEQRHHHLLEPLVHHANRQVTTAIFFSIDDNFEREVWRSTRWNSFQEYCSRLTNSNFGMKHSILAILKLYIIVEARTPFEKSNNKNLENNPSPWPFLRNPAHTDAAIPPAFGSTLHVGDELWWDTSKKLWIWSQLLEMQMSRCSNSRSTVSIWNPAVD